MKERVQLGAVQETLLIPLWARAVDFLKPHSILKDAQAAELVKRIDYDFSKFAGAWKSQVGCCLRGAIFDQWTRAELAKDPETLVVEIGAGLDTRYERLGGAARRWIDLDMPDSMALRRRFFVENSQRRFIEGSALEEDWTKPVRAMAEEHPVVFVAEGVLMYFSEEDVKRLFGLLARHFPGSSLLFDNLGPAMVKHQSTHDSVTKTAAKFAWGMADIREVETWGLPCTLEQTASFFDAPQEALRNLLWMERAMLLLSKWMKYRLNRVRFGGSHP